jgi:hypothetical protein
MRAILRTALFDFLFLSHPTPNLLALPDSRIDVYAIFVYKSSVNVTEFVFGFSLGSFVELVGYDTPRLLACIQLDKVAVRRFYENQASFVGSLGAVNYEQVFVAAKHKASGGML